MMRFFKRTAAFITAAAVALTCSNYTGIGQKIDQAYAGVGEIGSAYWGKTRGYAETAFAAADTGNTSPTVTLGKDHGNYDDLLCVVRKVTMNTTGTVKGIGSFTATNSADESKSGACQSDVRFYYNNIWYNTKDTSVGLGASPGSDTDSLYVPGAATVYVCYIINNNSTTAGRKVTWDLKVEISHDQHEGGTPTCTKRAVCKYCGKEYGEKSAHTYKNKWVKTDDADCTKKERGYFVYTCTVCGYSYSGSETTNGSLSGHSYSDYDAASDNELINRIDQFTLYSPASCNEPPQYYQKCSVCGKNSEALFKYGEALGHSYRVSSWNWASDYSSATPLYECGDENCNSECAGHTVTGSLVSPEMTEKNNTRVYTVSAHGTGKYKNDIYKDAREKYRLSCTASAGIESIIAGPDESGFYAKGENVTIKAIPVSDETHGHYELSGWKSDHPQLNGKQSNPLMFQMPDEPVNIEALSRESVPSGTLYAFNTSDSLSKYSGLISLTEGSSLSLAIQKINAVTEYKWQYRSVTEKNESGEPVRYSEWKDITTDNHPSCVVGAVSLKMDNSQFRCCLRNITNTSYADAAEGHRDDPYITLNVIPKTFSSISASYSSDTVTYGNSIFAENIILIAKYDNGTSEVIRRNPNIWLIDKNNPQSETKSIKADKTLGDNTFTVWFDNGEVPGPSNTTNIRINVIDDVAPFVKITSRSFDTEDTIITSDRTRTYTVTAAANDNFSNKENIKFRWYNEKGGIVSTTENLVLTGQNGKYYVIAEDENGNASLPVYTDVNVWDINEPEIEEISVTPDNEWAGYRIIHIKANDNNENIQYAFGGPYRSYNEAKYADRFSMEYSDSSSKIIESNGFYIVFAKDIAGNISKNDDRAIVRISGETHNGIDRSSPVITGNRRYYTKESVFVEISGQDPVSGISGYAYDSNNDNYIENDEWAKTTDASYVFRIEEDAKRDKAGRLFAVKDNAGNISKTTLYVYSKKGPFAADDDARKWVDETLGKYTYRIPSDKNTDNKVWLADGENVKIGFSKEIADRDTDVSPFLTGKYIWSNENGEESNKPETIVYDNGIYFAEIYGNTGSDDKGNAAPEIWGRIKYEVSCFDKKGPKVTASEEPFNNPASANRKCDLIIEADDPDSGIAAIWIKGGRFKEKTLIKEYCSISSINEESKYKHIKEKIELSLNGRYDIYASDSVGNESRTEIVINNIDVIDDSSIDISESSSHKITLISDSKTSVTASSYDTIPGTRVYLNYSSQDGYTLRYWESAEVEIFDDSFIMPDCDVTIHAFSIKTDNSVTHRVNIDPPSHGVLATLFSDTFSPGEMVYIAYKPDPGYELKELRGNVSINSDSFMMPDHDVTLCGEFIRKREFYKGSEVIIDPAKIDINIDTDDDGIPDINVDTNGDNLADTNLALLSGKLATNNIALPQSVSANSITAGKTPEGQSAFYKKDDADRLNPYVFPVYNEKNDNEYSHQNATDRSIYIDNNEMIINWDTDGDQWPDWNIDLDGDGTADICIENSENNNLILESDTEGCLVGIVGGQIPENGKEITLVYHCEDNNYQLKEWKCSRNINIENNKFIMPNAPLKIKGYFTKVENLSSESYFVKVNSDKNGVCAAAGSIKYHPGDLVSLVNNPYPGFVFSEWTSNEVKITDNTFVMPEADVNVIGHFVMDPLCSLSVTDNETKMTRENVTLNVNIPDGAAAQLADEPFSWDGGKTFSREASYQVEQNGIYVLMIKLADGSTFKCAPVCVDRIDRTAPTLVVSAFYNNISIYADDTMSKIATVVIESPSGASIKTIISSDDRSALKDGFQFMDGLNEDGSFKIDLKTDTTGEYRITAYDRLGNESSSTVYIETIPEGEGKNTPNFKGNLHKFEEQSTGSDKQSDSASQSLEYAVVKLKKSSYIFSGKPIIPSFSVKYRYRQFNNDGTYGNYKTMRLKENVDYTVTLHNNIDAGTATLILTGTGDFEGIIRKDFTIQKRSMKGIKCEKLPNFCYTGNDLTEEIEKCVILKDKGRILNSNEYNIIFSETPIGDPLGTKDIRIRILASENSNYSGELKKAIKTKIVSDHSGMYDLSGAVFALKGDNSYVYTGRAITPKVSVNVRGGKISKADYILQYENNTACGTASVKAVGRGRYAGATAPVEFKIMPADINDVKISKLSKISFRENISDLRPVVTYKGRRLAEGEDYYTEFEDISDLSLLGLKMRKARVKLTGMSPNFIGTKTITLTVKPRSLSSRLTTRIVVSDGELRDEYDQPQPKVNVYYNGKLLNQGEDYTVKFTVPQKPDRPGRATICGIGNYTGKRVIKFNIHLKAE